ncbi:ATP-binding protein [Lacticaseibacillus pabuli]|uniref:ATP-binding protein n=1 Tax=Lacticaseibacillus pabuli TaxID=3025672 RepID=A0ABY7WTX7_9LACO|nr:ATP-binding protein [Lacticaseibacillus sp. KACC 23028]WDF83608.1 ATP-binding protein [Lacticaseibacillus sp. KACC 23028]
MADSTSNSMQRMDFPLLHKVKLLDETCPKHPDQHLIQLPGHEPFCPLDTREDIQELGKQIELGYFAKRERYETTDVLARESIFDDDKAKNCTFDSYITKPGDETEANKKLARHLAGKYLNPNFRANTILTGTPGTGKTHLAMAMLNAVNDHIKPPTSCLFVNVNELARRVKDSFRYNDAPLDEKAATSLLGGVGLLVLDDLGSESVFKSSGNSEASDWIQQLLYGVINNREGRIIITTNFSNSELSRIYSKRLLSRMYRGMEAAGSVIKFTDKTADKRGGQL